MFSVALFWSREFWKIIMSGIKMERVGIYNPDCVGVIIGQVASSRTTYRITVVVLIIMTIIV